MTIADYSRPFWPLFLHILGAMTLVGCVLAALVASYAAWRRPELAILRRTAFAALVTAVPAFLLMRIFAEIIYSDEKDIFHGNDPTWVGIGFMVADIGLLVLLVTLGFCFWWRRSGKPVAGRIVAALSTVYLAMLVIAFLAMSGKWGS